MINNDIIELVWEVDGGVEFMQKCPLTIGGLKKLFLTTKEDRERYENFLEYNNYKDDEDGLFYFLNGEILMSDSEVIEEILIKEKEEYYWEFEDYNCTIDGFFKIYKINRGEK